MGGHLREQAFSFFHGSCIITFTKPFCSEEETVNLGWFNVYWGTLFYRKKILRILKISGLFYAVD